LGAVTDEKDSSNEPAETKKKMVFWFVLLQRGPPGEAAARAAEARNTTQPAIRPPIAGWVVARFVEMDCRIPCEKERIRQHPDLGMVRIESRERPSARQPHTWSLCGAGRKGSLRFNSNHAKVRMFAEFAPSRTGSGKSISTNRATTQPAMGAV